MLSPSLIFAALRRLLISASKSDLGIVLGDPLNHGLLLLFRHAAGFHLIQRYQHHIALHIAAHAVDRFTLLRQRQGKCQLAQRILAGTRKRPRRAKAQAADAASITALRIAGWLWPSTIGPQEPT